MIPGDLTDQKKLLNMSTENISKGRLIFGLPDDDVCGDVRSVIARIFARLTVEEEKNKKEFAENLEYLINHKTILFSLRGPMTQIVKVGFVKGKLCMFVYLARTGITIEYEICNRPMKRMFTSGWYDSDWVFEKPIVMDGCNIRVNL